MEALVSVSAPTLAKDDKTTITQTVENTEHKNSTAKTVSSDAKPFKSETVYAKIDGNGNVSSVTVSDQLKNIDNMGQLKDTSILKNIENVKGEETFSNKTENYSGIQTIKTSVIKEQRTEPLPSK